MRAIYEEQLIWRTHHFCVIHILFSLILRIFQLVVFQVSFSLVFSQLQFTTLRTYNRPLQSYSFYFQASCLLAALYRNLVHRSIIQATLTSLRSLKLFHVSLHGVQCGSASTDPSTAYVGTSSGPIASSMNSYGSTTLYVQATSFMIFYALGYEDQRG